MKSTFAATRNHKAFNERGDEPAIQDNQSIAYTSRMLACTRCGSQQETSWMQLRYSEGFRAVHCRSCGKQERCLRNLCQCGTTWHRCLVHRVDPHEHTSRKAPAKTKQQKQEEHEQEEVKARNKVPSRRKNRRDNEAPVIEDGNGTKTGSNRRKASKEQEFFRKRAAEEQRINPTISNLLQKIKARKVGGQTNKFEGGIKSVGGRIKQVGPAKWPSALWG